MSTTMMTTTNEPADGTALANPFATGRPAPTQASAAVESESQRAIAEVQAAIMLAKRFPRDQVGAMDSVLQACCRPTLAESAVYSYTRGGQEVTGPSIRLAEAIAQCWGNMQFGIRELAQGGGKSTVEAFAWDVENNTRQVKVFEVPHIRHTRQGAKLLTDPRDIYEMVANQGARRLRACILGVIPGDVVDAALAQCETTLKTKADVTPEGIKSLLAAFAEIGVTADQVAQKIGHRVDSIQPAEVVRLRKVYRGIKDGYTTVEVEFPRLLEEQAAARPQATAAATAAAAAAAKATGKKPADAVPLVDELRGHIAAATAVRTLGKIGDRVDQLLSEGQITEDEASSLGQLIDERHGVLEPAKKETTT
jgi:hypothetical protein